MPFMSAQRFFALGKESPSTRGTTVTPTYWIPISGAPTLSLMVNWLKDEGLRGSPNTDYGLVPGVRHDEYSFKGNVFLDSFPNLLMGVLGGPDIQTSQSVSTTVGSSPTALGVSPAAGVTLPVASSTGFSAGGGTFEITHTIGTTLWTFTGTYTGTGTNTLTGAVLNTGQGPTGFTGFTPTATTDAVYGGPPYTHTIGLLNQAGVSGVGTGYEGSQPPSFTGYDVDNASQSSDTQIAKRFGGAMFTDLDLEFTADGALTYSSKMMSNAFTEVSSTSVGWNGSSTVFVPAWNGGFSLDGTANGTLMSGSINIKRNVAPIHTINNTQSPYRLWAGPIVVTGKLTFVVENNDSWMNYGLATSYHSMAISFADPVSSNNMVVTMSKVQLQNPKIESSKAFLEITADFTANGNGTDAVATNGNGGGYSPIKVVVNNNQSTTY